MLLVFYDTRCSFCQKLMIRLSKSLKLQDVHFYDLSLSEKYLSINELFYVKKIDSILLIDKNGLSVYSEAIIKLFLRAGIFYKILGFIALMIPVWIRDSLYKFIARNRYFLSGHKECAL